VRELGAFEHQVLVVVRDLEGRGFGAEIARQIGQRTERGPPSPGQIYDSLARLSNKRLVLWSMSAPEPVRGGKAKRLYRLSVRGSKLLAAHEARLQRFAAGAFELEASA
jgi:PadR family transcriptional regulator PadR